MFILLRRLRQCIKLARMNSARHEEISRALRARGGQDRRREFVEAGFVHAPPNRARDLEPLHDDGVQRLAAEIEEAVLQAQIFRVFRFPEDRNRQLLGRRKHFNLISVKLDLARRQLGVDRTCRPLAHFTVDPNDPLGTHQLGRLERGTIRIGDDLRQTVVVAKIDEQDAAVVAHAMHPA